MSKNKSNITNTSPAAMPSGGFAAISKYNPHLWSPEQLRAIFVARQNELADLQNTLRSTPQGTVGQHVLLVGARGMGKSTLMQRLALAVEDDAALSQQWLALRFPEEQYTVSTLREFWANVLDALTDAIERTDQATQAIQALDMAAQHIATLPIAEQNEAYLKTITDCAKTRGQRLLLLVDNTDFLLSNIGKDAQWALRDVLQTQSHLLWVGGSYQSLEANSEYHEAFLDFFRVLELRPLKLGEMQAALLALAQTFGGAAAHAHMQHTLSTQPERLATLRQLSGGNPRTTVMLYTLLASSNQADQTGNVRSDLEALLDEMTPLYKSRLDNLADTPRKLLAHLLEHWSPMTLGELEDASQIKSTTISPQLKRLELEGLIEKTTLYGTTRSGYQAAERFFNIWYLMRLSPRRRRAHLLWLVEFMRLWFSPDELQHMANSRSGMGLSKERINSKHLYELEFDHALAEALPESSPERYALRWGVFKQLHDQREQLRGLFDLEGVDQDFKGAEDYIRRFEVARKQLQQCPHAKKAEERTLWVESVMGSFDLSLEEKEGIARLATEITKDLYTNFLDFYKRIQDLKAKDLGAQEVEALTRAVLNADYFPDMPDSKLAYEQIRANFSQFPNALKFVGRKMFLTHGDEWSLKMLCWAEQQFPNELDFTFERGWLLHNTLNRYQEAEATYRQGIALDGKNAVRWWSLGNLLHVNMGRYAEAEAAYRQAITLNEKNAYPVANLARLLWQQTRHVEAITLYKQVVDLSQKVEFDLRLQAHLVLGNKQLALDALHELAQFSQKNNFEFYKLKVQVWENSDLGLGETLADWMRESPHAVFLQPFIQALYELAGATHKLQDLPQEVQLMADEVVRLGRQRHTKAKPMPA